MRKKSGLLTFVHVWIALFLLSTFSFSQAISQNFWVTGYYPVWAPCSMTPEAMNYAGLTHLVHFSANPVQTVPYLDVLVSATDSAKMEDCGSVTGIVTRLLRNAHSHNVKVFLSLGGVFGTGATNMNFIAADSMRVEIFAQASCAYAKRRGYDGIEIDWEPPSNAFQSSRMFRTFRRILDTWAPRGELAVAVSNNDNRNNFSDYDIPTMVQCVDQSNIMMYDMHITSSFTTSTCGSTDVTGYNAPLERPRQMSPLGTFTWSYNDSTTGPRLWKKIGMPASKMAAGIPFYGYIYKGKGWPNEPRCTPAPSTPQYITYDLILQAQAKGGSVHWDEIAQVPFLSGVATSAISWFAAAGDSFYITYDDTASIARKVRWAKQQGLGGLMIYDLWEGWIPSKPAGQQDPLLQAVRNALAAANTPQGGFRGQLFYDKNRDGNAGPGELGIAGRIIRLRGAKIDSVLTDANGTFSFSSLGAGIYRLSQALPPGWVQSRPVPAETTLTLPSTDVQYSVDFGSYGNNVYDYLKGWNLISVPITLPFDSISYSTIFPTATEIFTSKTPVNAIKNGMGYWAKFPANVFQLISGLALPSVNFSLVPGWNLVGAPDHPASISLNSDLVGSVFGYGQGYYPASLLEPGRAYWVKAFAGGAITIGPASTPKSDGDRLAGYDQFIFRDASGNQQTLYFAESAIDPALLDKYELPPTPPSDLFDVRFESQRMLESCSSGSVPEFVFPLRVQSLTPPLEISYRRGVNSRRVLYIEERKNNRPIAAHELGQSGTLTSNLPDGVNLVLIARQTKPVPKDFTLSPNYPNPFNNSTFIEFTLPVDAAVRLTVFNLLGERIAILADGQFSAGSHTFSFDASRLSSGVYFYKLDAKSSVGSAFVQTNRMLYIR